MITYEKTYKPIHVNMDATLLARLDAYKSSVRPRSKLVHEAVEHYLKVLEQSNEPTAIWLSVIGGIDA
jgi:metal-responsive CopG/Arc/MetJ family transcriptional regulator